MNREVPISKAYGGALRLYPPVWFLLFAVSAAVLARLWPLPLPLSSFLQPFSVLLALLGGALALWAVLLFRRHRTSAHPYTEATALVTQGPYRITRNPMYLGLLFALIALGIWLQSLTALLLSPFFVLVINRCNILPEEQRMRARFGKTYETYMAQTRRWI